MSFTARFLVSAALLAVAGVCIADRKPDAPRRVKFTYPPVNPAIASGCSAEAAAYATAVSIAEAAVDEASDAYDAWQDCESEQMTPLSVEIPRSPSILVQD